ncbi:MAG: SPOR domain-containing protein [Desulfovibrio sp.]|jgi:cell division protein FtsN|nr:SPOR domain-containing protein [Desulfovibrio sp.]
MNAEDKNYRRTENSEHRREIVLSLRPAQIVGGIIVLCLGYAAVFFLGVVLGRGYTPEAGIPKLARLMPEASAPVSPRVVAAEEEKPAQESTVPSSPPPGGDEDTPFTQADLDYRERFKHRQQAASQVQGAGRTGNGTGQSARGNERKVDGRNAAQTRKNADGKAPEAAGATAKSGKNPAAPPDRAGEMYHYVYQVASYKDHASGDSFAKRLRAAGFEVRTEQSTGSGVTWFRTMVEFTGRPDDTDALRKKLKRFGVSRALLRSKTPAN